MFNAFERKIAARYLRARRGERFVSVIAIFSLVGIALGVATLIIVMSVMNGFRQELLSQILGLNGDIGVYGAGVPLNNYDEMAAKIRNIKGVTGAFPISQGEVLMSGPQGGATGGIARGITPAGLEQLPTVSKHVIAGSLENLKGGDSIAIGGVLAQQFNLSIGSQISLILPQGKATVIGTIPSIQSFKVVAIFQTGMQQYDSSFVFLPLQAAQTLFQQNGTASQIQVFVKNPDNDTAVKQAIVNEFPNVPLNIQDWKQNNNSFLAAVTVERNVMFLILTLIIIVAAFNVISSLIMMVKDKAKDIAILRTMGASSGSIMRIFLMAGASVGVLGTLIGFVLGVLFCEHINQIRLFIQGLTGQQLFNPTIYYLESLPAKLDWREVTEVIVMSLVLSVLATIYPSWRAAKIDPVETLRSE
ncbi:lipoprotein-releasing ABC transporter permease subunit [Acidocella aminolytica]|uniref:Lipoprotein releasing system transmembrane protein LolC/E n=1 Tax=Acidocella aminolytica 101 = DSM 11237 TaxID=1120923 RepID=A0A0D6PDH5_9PROT|nr:lipoprotein-releasing ABC transporter permease subunit [Acidocella aminolytica]GAN79707.1 lipoprotein releasing system transmembrane protein LolC/E [Acidocella aminolytica 101 = DSM 11237]GBQ39801.1 lipoprotein releasing system transmembrane protein LolC/E [Acidocella aminolytica 101 = DSM 11237]SHE73548.1 lipoprotein-releasing system permease protein [Acidocella aminolytica 101 = DSM 11237]